MRSDEIKSFVRQKLFDDKVVLSRDDKFPRFSVIIPSFNQGKFIERTILSVLNQNYPNTELIIIDGGSSDDTVDIIKKYEKYIYYWVSEKDRGQANAINKGLKVATGDFVAWQNSDDIYLPNAFFKFHETIKENPNYDVYYSDILVIDEEENIKDAFKVIDFSLFHNLYDDIIVHNQSAFFRKDVIIGKIDESFTFCFDLDLICKLGIEGAKFFPIKNFYGGAIRRHKEAKTSKILDVWRKERKAIISKYRKYTFPIPEKISYLICKMRKLILFRDDPNYIFMKIKKRFIKRIRYVL